LKAEENSFFSSYSLWYICSFLWHCPFVAGNGIQSTAASCSYPRAFLGGNEALCVRVWVCDDDSVIVVWCTLYRRQGVQSRMRHVCTACNQVCTATCIWWYVWLWHIPL